MVLVSLQTVTMSFSLNQAPPAATKVNAIVAGQTSVKAPEKAAFEAHLPKDVHILSCHSLHGPTVSPVGQPLVSLFFICTRPVLTRPSHRL